jgi:glyceraldehyde 3-phosphate dehydrogenase
MGTGVIRIGITGFGRVGRTVLRRALAEYPERLEIVAVNDLADAEALAYLLQYDSVYGRFPGGDVRALDGRIEWDGGGVAVTQERNPADIPWNDHGVDVVIDATGRFRTRASAERHRGSAGVNDRVRCVLIAGPGVGDDIKHSCVRVTEGPTLADGVLSIPSATATNVLAVLEAVRSCFDGTVEQVAFTTIHPAGPDQAVVDAAGRDPRRSRSALGGLIPVSGGAHGGVVQVRPELAGKVAGRVIRAPVVGAGCTDISVELSRHRPGLDAHVVAQAFEAASKFELRKLLGVTSDPLVSADVVGRPEATLVDLPSIGVRELERGRCEVRVLAWFDPVAAAAARLTELVDVLFDG